VVAALRQQVCVSLADLVFSAVAYKRAGALVYIFENVAIALLTVYRIFLIAVGNSRNFNVERELGWVKRK